MDRAFFLLVSGASATLHVPFVLHLFGCIFLDVPFIRKHFPFNVHSFPFIVLSCFFHWYSCSIHIPFMFIPMCIHVLSCSFHVLSFSCHFAFMSFHFHHFLSSSVMEIRLKYGSIAWPLGECNFNGLLTHRIHGAAIYGNMDPINIPPLC